MPSVLDITASLLVSSFIESTEKALVKHSSIEDEFVRLDNGWAVRIYRCETTDDVVLHFYPRDRSGLPGNGLWVHMPPGDDPDARLMALDYTSLPAGWEVGRELGIVCGKRGCMKKPSAYSQMCLEHRV